MQYLPFINFTLPCYIGLLGEKKKKQETPEDKPIRVTSAFFSLKRIIYWSIFGAPEPKPLVMFWF